MWWLSSGVLAVGDLGQNIMAYLLKAKIVEPEKQPLVGN
jgi:hypothetical protein